MSFNLENWINENKNGKIISYFNGNLTKDIITNFLDEVESSLNSFEVEKKTRKKLYNSVVEGIQNIYHHGIQNILESDNKDEKFGIAIIKQVEENYDFIHGNFINKSIIPKLKSRLDQINSLNTDELKVLYKMILNNEEFSDKGGGGLGMIDIARKSGSKIYYEFIDVDKNFSFYTFEIKI